MYIDFHSHVLPCADHGSDGIETSLSQIKYAREAGVDTIVATPHFYMWENTVEEFLERREKSYNELTGSGDLGVKIVKAAEVQLHTGIEKLDNLEALCVGNTKYILIEFPPEPWPYWIYESVYAIARERRLRPIVAHIDRYSSLGREKILKLAVDVQINASAFFESRRHRKEYIHLIEDDSVHILGSDTHGDGKFSYRDFTRAIKKLGGLADIITQNARRIITPKERMR